TRPPRESDISAPEPFRWTYAGYGISGTARRPLMRVAPEAAELPRRRESAALRDGIDAQRRIVEQRARELEPHARGERVDGDAGRAAERAREVARAHAGERRELVDRRPLLGMLHDRILHAMNAGMQMRAEVEVDAALFVCAVAPQVDDHLARDLRRHERTFVLLDERERHVDPGGDAGAGDDAVDNEEAVGEHARLRKTARELVRARPMRRAFAAVEEAGFTQSERPRADGRDLRAAARRVAQPANHF